VSIFFAHKNIQHYIISELAMKKKKVLRKRAILKSTIYANFRSQSDFAEVIGMGEQQVSQAICGRRRLSRREMARIAQVLNTPLNLLFPDEVEGR
jgi:transcriptional regulator with XRE-family HTH domain